VSRAVFVSDIHISSAVDPKYQKFLRFLDACIRHRVQDVFLVGDIFDFWIADRAFFTRQYNEAVVKIRQMVTLGIRVHYFEGNHDIDLRVFWQHQVGASVYSDAAFFQINGMFVRVEHGDMMDPEDKGYLFLRKVLRSPIVVFLGRYLPGFIVSWIGRKASLASRDYTTDVKTVTDEEVRAKILTHACNTFGDTPFDVIVSGHVHVAEDSVENVGLRHFRNVNLGTWLKKPILLDIREKSVELRAVDEFLDE
jgi:UDP-2,3-diacylglucosamine hydrolase